MVVVVKKREEGDVGDAMTCDTPDRSICTEPGFTGDATVAMMEQLNVFGGSLGQYIKEVTFAVSWVNNFRRVQTVDRSMDRWMGCLLTFARSAGDALLLSAQGRGHADTPIPHRPI